MIKKLSFVLVLLIIASCAIAGPPAMPPSSGGSASGVNTTYDADSDGIIDADKVATLNQNTTGTASTITGALGQANITALTEDTAPTSDDLLVTVDAPGTSPVTKKATIANVMKQYLVPGGTSNIQTWTGDYAFGATLTGATAVTFPTTGKLLSLNGTMTDEQLLCGENTDGVDRVKSCGAKTTYTEPDSNVTLCRTGASATGACTNPIKLASFAWDNGASAVTAEAASKRCVAVPTASTITGYTMVISGDPGAGGTIVTLAKDSLADTLTAGTLPTTDIDASAPPTVADNEVAATDGTLTGWTKTVAANDIISATVATNSVATWISLTIYGTY
jgi:hypothetical protein